MTTRRLGLAFLSLSLALAVYVPACEYDPHGGQSTQPAQAGPTYSKAVDAQPTTPSADDLAA